MKKRIPLKKIIAAILCCAIPLFFLVIGLRFLFRVGLPDPVFLTGYVYFPLAAILCFCLVIFLVKNIVARILLCIVIFVLYSTFGGFYQFMAPVGKIEAYIGQEAVRLYAEDETLREPMPQIPDLGAYETVSFYNHWEKGIFGSDTDVLIVSYDKEVYLQQHSSLQNTYSFLHEPITERDNYYWEPSVTINGYTFCVVDLDRKQYGYPTHMMLIGYNDDTCEIVYMFHLEYELDYISSLEEFVTDYCWWTYICKMD